MIIIVNVDTNKIRNVAYRKAIEEWLRGVYKTKASAMRANPETLAVVTGLDLETKKRTYRVITVPLSYHYEKFNRFLGRSVKGHWRGH